MDDKDLEELLEVAVKYYFNGMSAKDSIKKAMEEVKNGSI